MTFNGRDSFRILPQKLLADTNRLSGKAMGFYIRLLAIVWEKYRETCTIPDDDAYIASELGLLPDEWLEVKAEIVNPYNPLLVKKTHGFFSPYLWDERENQREYFDRQRRNANRPCREGKRRGRPSKKKAVVFDGGSGGGQASENKVESKDSKEKPMGFPEKSGGFPKGGAVKNQAIKPMGFRETTEKPMGFNLESEFQENLFESFACTDESGKPMGFNSSENEVGIFDEKSLARARAHTRADLVNNTSIIKQALVDEEGVVGGEELRSLRSRRRRKDPMTYEEFLKRLRANPRYAPLDLNEEIFGAEIWMAEHPNDWKNRFSMIVSWLQKSLRDLEKKKRKEGTYGNANTAQSAFDRYREQRDRSGGDDAIPVNCGGQDGSPEGYLRSGDEDPNGDLSEPHG